MSARLPVPRPAELDGLLPDLPAGLFDEDFHRTCLRHDAFVGALAGELARTLGLAGRRIPPVGALLEARGWVDEGRWTLQWLVETLELFGVARRDGEGWEVGEPSGALAAELRREGVARLPAAEPAYEVLDLCASALPAVLRGERRGEDALFGPATLGLWFEYFSNANPHYAPSNRLTAVAVARAAAPGARLLELGGGGGSAAEAVLDALSGSGRIPSRFVFTELHPAFLRRGSRHVAALVPQGCELRSARFDIDGDPAEAGLEAGAFDVVFAVNVLHLARDPVATLARLRTLLAPGGAVVLGELIRPAGAGGVHLELPFTLLEAYRQAPLLEGMRPRPGFMTLTGWRAALDAAGFGEVAVLPAELERCQQVYAGFYCGALTAR